MDTKTLSHTHVVCIYTLSYMCICIHKSTHAHAFLDPTVITHGCGTVGWEKNSLLPACEASSCTITENVHQNKGQPGLYFRKRDRASSFFCECLHVCTSMSPTSTLLLSTPLASLLLLAGCPTSVASSSVCAWFLFVTTSVAQMLNICMCVCICFTVRCLCVCVDVYMCLCASV